MIRKFFLCYEQMDMQEVVVVRQYRQLGLYATETSQRTFNLMLRFPRIQQVREKFARVLASRCSARWAETENAAEGAELDFTENVTSAIRFTNGSIVMFTLLEQQMEQPDVFYEDQLFDITPKMQLLVFEEARKLMNELMQQFVSIQEMNRLLSFEVLARKAQENLDTLAEKLADKAKNRELVTLEERQAYRDAETQASKTAALSIFIVNELQINIHKAILAAENEGVLPQHYDTSLRAVLASFIRALTDARFGFRGQPI